MIGDKAMGIDEKGVMMILKATGDFMFPYGEETNSTICLDNPNSMVFNIIRKCIANMRFYPERLRGAIDCVAFEDFAYAEVHEGVVEYLHDVCLDSVEE